MGRRRAPTWRRVRGSVGAILLTVALWELVARSELFPPVLLPGVGEVAGTFLRVLLDGTLLANTATTAARLVTGYVIAVVLGIGGGLLMGRSRLSEEIGLPLVSFLLPIPSIALVPLFTIWFGLGSLPTIVLVIFVATPPIALNTYTGVRGIDPVLLRAASAMGSRGADLFRKVMLPAALPGILAGLRFGLSVAWRATIAGELISATETGLGWMLFDAREFLHTDVMLATLVAMALLGMVIERIGFEVIERRTLMRWGMTPAAEG
ncbi:MAG: ABC transporter permease [Dehalococcoidia bacterium]